MCVMRICDKTTHDKTILFVTKVSHSLDFCNQIFYGQLNS